VAEFDIMFNEGISKEGDLLDLGVARGIIKKSGAFFSFGETRLGQGRENAKEYLRQYKDLAQDIEQQIRAISAPEPDFPSSKVEPEAEPLLSLN
jgi:recombination protein RecA